MDKQEFNQNEFIDELDAIYEKYNRDEITLLSPDGAVITITSYEQDKESARIIIKSAVKKILKILGEKMWEDLEEKGE